MVKKEEHPTEDCPGKQFNVIFKWTINGEPCLRERYFNHGERHACLHITGNEIKEVPADE